MKDISRLLLLSVATVALSVASAHAADRVHAGQWETTIDSGARTRVMKSCVTPAEADAANGDEKTFRESLAKAIAGTGCTVSEVKVSGNQVVTSSLCSGKKGTSTTNYHGDSYEQVSSNGTKVHAKRIGSCS